MNDNKINFKTPRTKVGTMVEIAVVALILIMWGLIIHWTKSATPDDTKILIITGAEGTIIPAGMLALCYFPKTFNFPSQIEPKPIHYLLSIYMVRLTSIYVILIHITSAWSVARPNNEIASKATMVLCGMLVITAILFLIYFYRKFK